ncbi:MAG: nucleoside deaminase [Proteobacteria bacterium]|nr:nucleoside deaminase [Pseudomonadota bacterium]
MGFYHEALKEAKKGLAEGGIPIGAVLVYEHKIIGRGHNRRIQKGSAILHGEMDAFENAGRLPAKIYQHCTLYTTLSPCAMCSGTSMLYNIPRIIIGENINFKGDEVLLASRGVQLIILQDQQTIQMMANFIKENPMLWNEDIGVYPST